MPDVNNAIKKLTQSISLAKDTSYLSFSDFLELAAKRPHHVFRNIFQIVNDMVHYFIVPVHDSSSQSNNNCDFVNYDTSKLLVDNHATPFFADKLFARTLVQIVDSFVLGSQQNKIYNFQGPPGSGKSTFLNNFLQRLEDYTRIDEGICLETVWHIDKRKLNGKSTVAGIAEYQKPCADSASASGITQSGKIAEQIQDFYLDVPCPSHDNPILLVPKSHRLSLLEDLLGGSPHKEEILSKKEYQWVFRQEPCTICSSLYDALFEKTKNADEVFGMLYARRHNFNRRLGEGISVYNPGDIILKQGVITNEVLQTELGNVFKDSNKVNYIFSTFAHTNNGVYVLMDIKLENERRFRDLHGITSDGVHKIGPIEESVNSMFISVMNYEDRKVTKNMQSFADRMDDIEMHYVRDPVTEIDIYRNTFGPEINFRFLPRILENFAKIVVSTRLEKRSAALSSWIGSANKYARFCDEDLLLLKMDIYSGTLPKWLSEEDRKSFNHKIKKEIDTEAEKDGLNGFSGRESLDAFARMLSQHSQEGRLFTMSDIKRFFRRLYPETVSSKFLDSIGNLYDYEVLQEVKDAMYNYNEDRISKDVQNYLYAINFEKGAKVKCPFTMEQFEINDQFLVGIERNLFDKKSRQVDLDIYRQEMQKMYCTDTLTKEMGISGKHITETTQYRLLFEAYAAHLKENVLDPFINNDNFRNAIRDYSSERFTTYDQRIQDDVTRLINSLIKKHKYQEESAKQICIYVIDNDLAGRHARNYL